MKICITKELIEFANEQNSELEIKALKRMKINFFLILLFMFLLGAVSYVAVDFELNIPRFYSPNNYSRAIVPKVNSEPLKEHMSGYVRRKATNLLSLDFNNLKKDLLERKSLFIDGKYDEYLMSIYGGVDLSLPPQPGTFAHKVLDESLVITAVAYGTTKKVGGKFMIEGKENHVFVIELWQGSEGIGSEYVSQPVKAHIMVQKVSRTISKNGLLIRSFYVKD